MLKVEPSETERFHSNLIILRELLTETIKDLWTRGYKLLDPQLLELAGAIIAMYDKIKLLEDLVKLKKKLYLI